MKPYGAPGKTYPFGWEERRERLALHRWYDGDKAGGNFVREADRLLKNCLAALGSDLPPREVLNLYAYAFRAPDARALKAWGLDQLKNLAWHQSLLEAVRPRLVLCIGNGPAPSAFALYRELFPAAEVTEITPRPRLKVRWLRGGGTVVLGVPHLSYVRAGEVWETVSGVMDAEVTRGGT